MCRPSGVRTTTRYPAVVAVVAPTAGKPKGPSTLQGAQRSDETAPERCLLQRVRQPPPQPGEAPDTEDANADEEDGAAGAEIRGESEESCGGKEERSLEPPPPGGVCRPEEETGAPVVLTHRPCGATGRSPALRPKKSTAAACPSAKSTRASTSAATTTQASTWPISWPAGPAWPARSPTP